jgi:hypothetical protein
MSADNAIEQAFMGFVGKAFSYIINPLIVLFVSFAIFLFLAMILDRFMLYTLGWGLPFLSGKSNGPDQGADLKTQRKAILWALMGVVIMLCSIGITFFLAATADDLFGGSGDRSAKKGLQETVSPLQIK